MRPSQETSLNTIADPPGRDRWARLRFSIIGPLMAAPPAAGELYGALQALAAKTSLGSVGLLKSQLLQLAWLQMQRKGEAFTAKDMLRAVKPPKQLAKIEKETAEGEAELAGACYGEADFGGAEELKRFFERLTGKAHA